MSLNINQKLPAISNSIQLKEDVSDYYLQLFFINVHLYKIMKSYKEPVSTASEASRFENIQFDINPFHFQINENWRVFDINMDIIQKTCDAFKPTYHKWLTRYNINWIQTSTDF